MFISGGSLREGKGFQALVPRSPESNAPCLGAIPDGHEDPAVPNDALYRRYIPHLLGFFEV